MCIVLPTGETHCSLLVRHKIFNAILYTKHAESPARDFAGNPVTVSYQLVQGCFFWRLESNLVAS